MIQSAHLSPAPKAALLPWRDLLPREHGAWALFLMPLALGLGFAHGMGSLVVAGAFVCGFLGFGAWRRWRVGGGRASASLAAALGGAAGGFGAWSWGLGGPRVLGALLLGLVLALPVLADPRPCALRRRETELLSAAALSTVLPALLLAGGWGWGAAFRAWALLLMLEGPALVLLRERLARARKRGGGRGWACLLLHVLAAGAGLALWRLGSIPPALAIWSGVLALRAAGPDPRLSPRELGWREVAVSAGHLGVLGYTLILR